MREGQFVQNFNKKLPRTLHQQPNTGGYSSTPDRYYDGPKSDLWVEWKLLERLPRDGIVRVLPIARVKKQPNGHLSVGQYTWINRRYRNGGNAMVMVAMPDRKSILAFHSPVDWDNGKSTDGAMTIEETIEWISKFCGV